MNEYADELASLPAVTNVPDGGGEVIPLCGSVTLDDLEPLVDKWWDRVHHTDA